jgi:glycosyltransferase involved in cell wall biosynthesis
MSAKHITVLVSNDLEFDQRVKKTCDTLHEMGFEITLVGRFLPTSKSFSRPYEIKRFKLPFDTGVAFYLCLQVALFFYLWRKKTDVILANDLDTLWPAYLISRWRNKGLVYDSHELFTEAEGLTGHPVKKWIWSKLEQTILPKLKKMYTVNRTIAGIFEKKYGITVGVVRNIALLESTLPSATREQLQLPIDKCLVLLQGSYIDPDRGGEEAVLSMKYLDNAHLLIIGSGRAIPQLRLLVEKEGLKDKVTILDKMPFHQLRKYTACADFGLSLDKPLHLNYTYSLPNKVFDYIHCGVPIIVSDLPELRSLVEQHNVGLVVREMTPESLAVSIQSAMESNDKNAWKQNCLAARESLNWQNESKVIQSYFSDFI